MKCNIISVLNIKLESDLQLNLFIIGLQIQHWCSCDPPDKINITNLTIYFRATEELVDGQQTLLQRDKGQFMLSTGSGTDTHSYYRCTNILGGCDSVGRTVIHQDPPGPMSRCPQTKQKNNNFCRRSAWNLHHILWNVVDADVWSMNWSSLVPTDTT